MAPQTLAQMHQSSLPSALPGTWKLGAGRAITLRPGEHGTLRVAHGRIWATFDGPHQGSPNGLGDHVIGVGERLWVRSGQRVVIQSWNRQDAAYFSWDPALAPVTARGVNLAGVLQPLADLRLALVFGAGAVARLAAGMLQLAWGMVVPRERRGAACPNGA
jgi:hypothetical protein